MAQATLVTPRLRLVPLSEEHLELEVELDTDPEVMRYVTGRASTREESEVFHRRRLAAAERVDGLGAWVGFLDGDFIGWWVLRPPQRDDQGPIDGNAELGYRLLRRHWARGLASEGSRELVRHGFDDLGLQRIFAEAKAANTASRATLSTVGLRYVRRLDLYAEEALAGDEPGVAEYEITRQEWLGRIAPG